MEITNKPSKQALADRACIRAILNGQPDEFQKLMDRYYDAIFFTMTKMIHNKTEAEGLALEVFSKAYQNLSTYSEDYAFSTWLFRIATNRGIDYIRRKSTNTITIEEEGNDNYDSVVLQSDSQLQPDKLLIKHQLSEEIKSLVSELKPLWQDLINMRYYKELSYEEIAEELDIPMGTVKNQLHRAKQKLALLAEHQHLEDYD